MNLLTDYVHFLLRPLPHPRVVPLVDYYPNAWTHYYALTAFFVVANRLVPFILRTFWSKWWADVPEKKKEEYPAYVMSLIHHLVAVPFGWILFVEDFRGKVDYTNPQGLHSLCEQLILPWCAAYLTGDAITYCLPQLITRGSWEYMVHHVAALWMSYELMALPNANFVPCFAHMVICETTGIFFCAAWLLRAAGYRDSTLVTVLEQLFALSFFWLRGINITAVFFHMFFLPESSGLGIVRFTFPGIALLQWFWLIKIIQSIFSRGKGGAGKSSKSEKKN